MPGAALADAFRPVLTANRPALHRLRQRATSYWNCYYRWDYPAAKDYPGMQVLDRLAEVTNS